MKTTYNSPSTIITAMSALSMLMASGGGTSTGMSVGGNALGGTVNGGDPANALISIRRR